MSMGYRPRVIPCLLLAGSGLVKTQKFDRRVYLGDPINTVRIFNDKGADELMLLDIDASRKGRPPPFDVLADIASEAFMPLAYGGGIRDVEDVRSILRLGFEKVVINTAAAGDPGVIERAASAVGSSSIVASIDVRRPRLGRPQVVTRGGGDRVDVPPSDYARMVVERGAGEILLQSVDRDGTRSGYDTALIREVCPLVPVPVVACGGAGSLDDFKAALDAGASAVAAGSIFVFTGKHQAVLISYPGEEQVAAALGL